MRVFSILVPLALSLLLGACSAQNGQDAKQLVNNFYQANQSTHPTGALTLSELLTFRQFVSIPLFELLKTVSEAEEAHLRDAPEDEPPLVEGNLLTSHPLGATTYRILNCKVGGDQNYCRIELVYSDASHKTPYKWVDRVVLSKDVRGWVIDNIVYAGGNSPLKSGDLHSTLLHILGSPDLPNPENSIDYE